MLNKISSKSKLRERSHSGGDFVMSDTKLKRSSSSVGNKSASISTFARGQATTSSYNKKQILYQEFRIRWSLLSARSKICLSILLSFITFQALMSAADTAYQYSAHRATRSKRSHVSREPFFAVVINTYKRPEMLREAAHHYGETCGRRSGVGQVFVVWAELQTTPPNPESLFQKSSSSSSRGFLRSSNDVKKRSQFQIIRAEKDSLNSRFLPINNLQSQAVFMVDDDVRVDCKSLKRGFEAWKANPDSMVGYYPRLAAAVTRATKKTYVYQAWPIVWWRQSINFVLTKASFFHSNYLSLYSNSSKHPVEILDYVDKHMNCEDVAMALLVANTTRTANNNNNHHRGAVTRNNNNIPIIYVEGNVHDKGLFNGISTKKGHMDARSRCLDDLTAIYQQHGWPPPLDAVFPLDQASWVRHVTGWQYRPSNIFEWFALENIFK